MKHIWSDIFNEIQKWRAQYDGKIVVVKFGGALAEDDGVVTNIAQQIDFLSHLNIKPIVVHGGGRQIDEDLKAAGLEIRKDPATGRRITDAATLAVSDQSLRRLNENIVELFNQVSRPMLAVGQAAYQQRAVTATSAGPELGGYTGENPVANARYFLAWLNQPQAPTPIIYPICAADNGHGRFNVNADDVAEAIAVAVGANRLVLCSDIPGILGADGNIISEMTRSDIEMLIANGTINGGMIAKARSALKAVERLPDGSGVAILDGSRLNNILAEVFSDIGGGTLIKKQQRTPLNAPRPNSIEPS